MKYFAGTILIFLLIISYRCNVSESMTDTFYYNSFESAEDTSGWYGITTKMFTDESSPGSGKRSLLIRSDGTQPAAAQKIRIEDEGYYTLLCWGKTKTNGGTICVSNSGGDKAEEKCIRIINMEWEHYTSNELYCSPDSFLKIEIFTDEISSDLLIDGIKIRKL